jgi:hypothetical protein
LIAQHLEKLLDTHKQFEFEFLNTAISKKGKDIIERVFRNRPDWLYINNIALVDSANTNNESMDQETEEKSDEPL